MHVLIGLLMVFGALYGARALDGATFGTFGHAGTILLIFVGPIGAAVMSFDARSLWNGMARLFEAIGGRAEAKRQKTLNDCYEVGRALRSGQPLVASRILAASTEPLLRQCAPLVLQKSSGADIEGTVATLSYQRLVQIRTGEDLFGTLSRSAPAFGLIGTIFGLVEMLRALKDFEKLGPGMALAVMSTFYGLVLSQTLYVPLSKIIERYGHDTSVTAELLGRALSSIADGRALSEVRVLGAAGVPDAMAPGRNGTGAEDVA